MHKNNKDNIIPLLYLGNKRMFKRSYFILTLAPSAFIIPDILWYKPSQVVSALQWRDNDSPATTSPVIMYLKLQRMEIIWCLLPKPTPGDFLLMASIRFMAVTFHIKGHQCGINFFSIERWGGVPPGMKQHTYIFDALIHLMAIAKAVLINV